MFQKLPIKQKLVLLSILIAGGALFMFTLVSAFNQVRIMRQAMLENLMVIAESIADLSSAALSFSDRDGAAEILRTLRADQDIEVAVLYDTQGKPLAVYRELQGARTSEVPQEVYADLHRFLFHNHSYKLEIFQPVRLEGRTLGTLYLLSNTDRMVSHLKNSVLMLLLGMVAVLAVTVAVSSRLQELITRPVSLLAKTARNVFETGDYSVRVEKASDDEVGRLIDDFNTMLAGIQERDAELQHHRQHLEVLVQERTEELRAKRDEALAAARAKSEFLANMSHEIRTPMNGVIGVLSLLRDVPMSGEHRRLLDTATRSADSLLLIISDILDFSKIDAGKITFESIVFDLRELMEETSELFIDTLNLKNLDLTCFVPTDIPCRIQGDPTRLRQILTNLLSNAVKFTEKGEVRLQVSTVNRRGARQELLFSIEDTGIGIAGEVTGRLFEKFTQADGSTTRKYGGTGLGLSVCKQLVEQQGGKIGVRSSLGSGATFWFSLEFDIVEDSCALIPYSRLQGKTFLLVDGSRTNCAIIEHYLRFCDATARICPDGQSCLDRLAEMHQRDEAIDTILINHRLNDIDGLQLAETIHRRYAGEAPGLVLMSTTTLIKAQLRRAGVRGTLRKPVRQLDLYRSLADEDARGKQKLPEGEKIRRRENDIPQLRGSVLLVDDEPINQHIALAILRKFGLETDVAGSGLEAVRMSAQKDYSVMLMDIQMPEMSGFEATEEIRKREALSGGKRRSVIIAMTANATESTRDRCFEVGMDDFFTKPIKPDVLAERLLPWLASGKEADDDVGGPLPPEPGGRSASLESGGERMWDRQTALGFVGGDEGLLRELVGLFLLRSDTLLAAIAEGLRAGDATALRDSAHAYKGAVSHFGAQEVRKMAMTLENMGKNNQLAGSMDAFEELRGAARQLLQELTAYLQQGVG